MNSRHQASVDAGGSQAPLSSKSRRGPKSLPDWVHPKWAKTILPTLTHALYISKDPFEEFKSLSPSFIATVQKVFDLVYPHAMHDVTEGDAVLEEVSCQMSHPHELT